MNRQLSQQEIDAVFENLGKGEGGRTGVLKTAPFDFRRPDRIPKSQLRALRLLHENFVRSLASSLSAYLRTYLTANLVSVEQLSYAEFVETLSSPTCLVSLGLRPYDGHAVLELGPSLTFQILEVILGGKGKGPPAQRREITEIERSLLDGLLHIILSELKQAWESVTAIEFTVESLETEPQFLQVPDPGEAFVAVTMELKVGEVAGLMNLALPSLIIKMMRAKFDHHGSLRKTQSSGEEQARMLRLMKAAKLSLDARLRGSSMLVRDLLSLAEGNVVPLDYAVERPLELLVNGRQRFRGQLVSAGNKKAFVIAGREEQQR